MLPNIFTLATMVKFSQNFLIFLQKAKFTELPAG